MMITAGPDGNLWFTAQGFDSLTGRYDGHDFIVKMSTSGVMTQFAIPTPNAKANNIVKGPDGNLWFCESNANRIGKITPSGAITEYLLPHSGSGPDGLTVGPDHELWFTEFYRKKIGHFTTWGAESEYPVPSGASPENIAAGADGNLYFIESGGKIGVLMF
jgi:virginiamycin B lyase